jgi:hypothetical protein
MYSQLIFNLLLDVDINADFINLQNDIIMELHYSCNTLNNIFQIYSQNEYDVHNNNLINLKFHIEPINSDYTTILPPIESFGIVNDPLNCGFLSASSRRRTIGYEYLSFLSNKFFNTNTDFTQFINSETFMKNTHQGINDHYTNLLSTIVDTPFGGDNKHISEFIYKTVATSDPSRLLETNHLGNNMYSNFLKAGDILQYYVFIDPINGKINLNDDTLVSNNNNNIQSREYLCKILLT